MRKESITAFVSIYAALCIAYGVIGTGAVINSFGQDDMISDETSRFSDNSSTSSAQESSSVSKAESSAASDTESSAAVTEYSEETESNNSPDESSYEGFYYENNDEESPASENEAEPSQIEPDIDSGLTEEIISGDISEDESQEQLEDEYVQDKPTLEDFLRGLRCSGCRHNCSLLSPRCMNGARKASQAESEYYQTYGT